MDVESVIKKGSKNGFCAFTNQLYVCKKKYKYY